MVPGGADDESPADYLFFADEPRARNEYGERV
jgi:hypothetical protein